MISKEGKKEAIAKFKERKPLLGVYAVRCTASGRAWVGASRNLDAARNAVWFSLRLGIHRERPIQDEWNAFGESEFEYEVLDKLPEDAPVMLVSDLLKDAKQRWMTRLGAPGLL